MDFKNLAIKLIIKIVPPSNWRKVRVLWVEPISMHHFHWKRIKKWYLQNELSVIIYRYFFLVFLVLPKLQSSYSSLMISSVWKSGSNTGLLFSTSSIPVFNTPRKIGLLKGKLSSPPSLLINLRFILLVLWDIKLILF